MKKTLRLALWVVGILMLAALITSPYLIWLAEPMTPLRVKIIDKTVPSDTYREHAALTWVLNHFKIEAPEQAEEWQENRDYTGFHPFPSPNPENGYGTKDRLTAAQFKGQDLVFITDTYGVYQQDFRISEQVERERAQSDKAVEMESPDYSPQVYGGLESDEVAIVRSYTQAGGNLIAEFNTFASPTKGAARQEMEDLLGLDWTGWTGRFFERLEDEEEVPAWARRNYQAHYNQPWKYQGPGWLIVHEDSRIFVLEEGKDTPKQALKIYHLNEHPFLRDSYDKVPYMYWFDINQPQAKTQVLAEYRMQVTESGQKILDQFGVKSHFPFLSLASEKPMIAYFAGDVSDKFHEVGSYQVAGRGPWERFGRFKESNASQSAFFWEFYLPVMNNILTHLKPEPEPTNQP